MASPTRRSRRKHPGDGAVVVRLTDKARTMDHALDLASQKKLMPQDLATLWFICTHTDNQSGECIRRYEAIAAGCGVSRSTAVRSVARLKRNGILEIRERFYKETKGKTATAFKLSAVEETQVTVPNTNRGSTQRRTILDSPLHHIPDGGDQLSRRQRVSRTQRANSNADAGEEGSEEYWADVAEWLGEQGRYNQRFGYDGASGAIDDLELLRATKGDEAIMQAVRIAREMGLYGENLSDFLENTWPKARGRSGVSPRRRRRP